ncbi:Trypsin-like peptidase domain protein [Candidatus Norongarragalina meridionalis]|nr:Trypsin-like peptidase domain protein [Candidatus Norongarragalina meridionalis]
MLFKLRIVARYMVACPKCGRKAGNGEFCVNCGARLPKAGNIVIDPSSIFGLGGRIAKIVGYVVLFLILFGIAGYILSPTPSDNGNTTNSSSTASCEDGTPVKNCSNVTKGDYCLKNGTLAFDCGSCGCPGASVCYGNRCMTEEERTGWIIDDLQQSVVYVKHSYASGSGVIIAQSDERTLILTNRHVVADADGVSDLKITTRDQQTVPADAVYVAPFDMDLALIVVLGTYGKPATVNVSEPIYQGQAVIAVGSPLGIQGSASNGIISNIINDNTPSGYNFYSIQTDAAINPGNSGGGLFLKSTGDLIGINTYVIASDYGAEGLGFSISARSIDKLPTPVNWGAFSAKPKCSDRTPYDSCSGRTVGLYCSTNGQLLNDCKDCGCPTDYWCLKNGVCFNCPVGQEAYQVRDGSGFCCPIDYSFYEEDGGLVYCCPPGTVGYVGGYCE